MYYFFSIQRDATPKFLRSSDDAKALDDAAAINTIDSNTSAVPSSGTNIVGVQTSHKMHRCKSHSFPGNLSVWCGTPKARNKIPNFQNPKAFILEGLDKN